MMPFEELDAAAFDRTMKVNAYGPYYTSRGAWPHFSDRATARMVNVASSAGLFALPDRVDYGASKAAVVGMMRSLASESEGLGITVNAVVPSAITRMSSEPQKKHYAERFDIPEAELLEKTPYLARRWSRGGLTRTARRTARSSRLEAVITGAS
jgi:NAD(P)-dependent dehydrogenase (short-subunit alcohol dehydrogenase family)